MDIYHTILMDHYHNPRNYGTLESCDFSVQSNNPSCGDKVNLEGRVAQGVLIDVRFNGTGCIISQAASSLLSQLCIGKELGAILALTGNDMQKLLGSSLGPLRLKCALLSLQALQEGIITFQTRG